MAKHSKSSGVETDIFQIVRDNWKWVFGFSAGLVGLWWLTRRKRGEVGDEIELNFDFDDALLGGVPLSEVEEHQIGQAIEATPNRDPRRVAEAFLHRRLRRLRGQRRGDVGAPPEEHRRKARDAAQIISRLQERLNDAIDNGRCAEAFEVMQDLREFIGAYERDWEEGEGIPPEEEEIAPGIFAERKSMSPAELRQAATEMSGRMTASCLRPTAIRVSRPRVPRPKLPPGVPEPRIRFFGPRGKVPFPSAWARLVAYVQDRRAGLTVQKIAEKYKLVSAGPVQRVLREARAFGIGDRPGDTSPIPETPPEGFRTKEAEVADADFDLDTE